MGVRIQSREYVNSYRPEKPTWMIGNVGDWQQLQLNFRVACEIQFSQTNPLIFEDTDKMVLGNGKGWGEYGFDVGDSVVLTYTLTSFDSDGLPTGTFPITKNMNITNIWGDTMEFTGTTNPNYFQMFPIQTSVASITNVLVYCDKRPEGAYVTYGHMSNEDSDSLNLTSFIDGTTSKLKLSNMQSAGVGVWQTAEKVGMQSGMSIDFANWSYFGKIGTHTYSYVININYMLSSIFEDISNLETNTAPSTVFDANSLTDNFDIRCMPKWNNPNCVIKNDLNETKRLGNTGWFDENFNDLRNDFVVESIEYFDQANNPISTLSYGNKTKVKAIISGVQNMADGQSKYGLGFAWIPDDENYIKNLESSFHENLLINTAGVLNTGVYVQSNAFDPTFHQGFSANGAIRMDVRDVRFSQSGSNLVYEATFEPMPGFKTFIESLNEVDRNFLLWVSVADRTLASNFSNRVSLRVDFGKMDLEVLPIGEWSPLQIEFFEHESNGTEITSFANTNFFLEDDILARIKLGVDINENKPSAIEFGIEAKRTDGLVYNLEKYKVNLSSFPLDGNGVAQWDFDQSRGFKLEPGNNKNFIKVKRDAPSDIGTLSAYLAFYGFKVRWEDWIARLNVPADFFDSNELNNGFNNDWLHYFEQAGWDIYFTVKLDAIKDGNSVVYKNSKKFEVRDYNDNPNLIKDWFFFRESDSTALPVTIDPLTTEPLGVILDAEEVRVAVRYTRVSGTWSDLTTTYGTICIEIDKGAGELEFRQISSIWGREADNPLIPVAGQTKLKLTLTNPNEILMECLIDPTLLQDAVRYKLTSRLGCTTGSGGGDIDEGFIFTQLDDVLDTNNNRFLIAN